MKKPLAELCARLLVLAVDFGGVLASTWIGRTLGHAEETATLVKPGCKKVSCQRRQLRTGCLKTSLLPTSWACASGSGSS